LWILTHSRRTNSPGPTNLTGRGAIRATPAEWNRQAISASNAVSGTVVVNPVSRPPGPTGSTPSHPHQVSQQHVGRGRAYTLANFAGAMPRSTTKRWTRPLVTILGEE
jgi:hypothetical protein